MIKILLLLALCAGTGTLMAQTTTLAPFNNLSGKLNPPLKVDSPLLKLSITPFNRNLFKQEPMDFKKLIDNKIQKSLFIANEVDKMPVAKLDGYSKMPVVILEGYSKMPVVGKAFKPANNTLLVNP